MNMFRYVPPCPQNMCYHVHLDKRLKQCKSLTTLALGREIVTQIAKKTGLDDAEVCDIN
jgi:hypothetical protein